MKKIKYFLFTCLIWFFSNLEKLGYPWHKMPKYFALFAILVYRERLRRYNLFSANEDCQDKQPALETSSLAMEYCGRTLSGAYTDIQNHAWAWQAVYLVDRYRLRFNIKILPIG